MAIQLVRTMGIVQLAEEQRAAVVGPGQAAVAVGEGQGGDFAAGQLLDVEGVDLVAFAIQAVGQAAMVGADAEGAEIQVAIAGQHVGVEQQLLAGRVDAQRAVGRTRAAVMARVLLASRGALVVQPRTPGGRQRQVGLADARADFLEQLLAQFTLVGELLFQPGILGLQVFEDLGAVALLQPGIGIGASLAAGKGRGEGHRLTPAAADARLQGKAAIISALIPLLPRTDD
ncbi:hypothetical protein D3C86_1515030 [compost metagenome]